MFDAIPAINVVPEPIAFCNASRKISNMPASSSSNAAAAGSPAEPWPWGQRHVSSSSSFGTPDPLSPASPSSRTKRPQSLRTETSLHKDHASAVQEKVTRAAHACRRASFNHAYESAALASLAKLNDSDEISKLCGDIAWIRKRTADVVECDALLASNLDQKMQDLGMVRSAENERRMRSTGAVGRKFADRQLRMKNLQVSWFGRTSRRRNLANLAICIFQWYHRTGMVRDTLDVADASSLDCLKLRVLHEWMRNAIEQAKDKAVHGLKVDILLINGQKDTNLSEMMSAHLENKSKNAVALMRKSLKVVLVLTCATLFESWTRHWREETEVKWKMKRVQSFMQQFMFACDSQLIQSVWRAWTEDAKHLVLQRAHETKKKNCSVVMVKAMLLLNSMEDADLLKVCYQRWVDEVQIEKRITHSRRRSAASVGCYVEKLEEQKLKALEYKAKLTENTMRQFAQMFNGGLSHDCVLAWKETATKERSNRMKDFLAMELQASVGRAQKREVQLEKQMHTFSQLIGGVKISNYFAGWWRVVMEIHEKALRETLNSEDRANDQIAELTPCVRQLELTRAVKCLEKFVNTQERVVKHSAMGRWFHSARRRALDSLNGSCNAVRDKAQQARNELALMYAEVAQHCGSCERQVKQIRTVANLENCRRVLGWWSLAARESNSMRLTEHRMSKLDETSREFEAIARHTRRQQGRHAAQIAAWAHTKCAFEILFHGWMDAASTHKTERHMEELNLDIARVSHQLTNVFEKKYKQLQTPLMMWGMTAFGKNEGQSKKLSTFEQIFFFRAWAEGVTRFKVQDRIRKHKMGQHKLVVELAEELATLTDGFCLRRALTGWHIGQLIGAKEKDQDEKARLEEARLEMWTELISVIKVRTTLLAREEAQYWVVRLFGMWRRYVGVTVVERTGEQVCTTLENKAMHAEERLEHKHDKCGMLLTYAFHHSQGDGLLSKVMASLLLPAWRDVAKALRLWREHLQRDEEVLAEQDVLRRCSVEHRCRWSQWSLVARARVLDQRAVNRTFHAWLLVFADSREERRQFLLDRMYLASVDALLRRTALGCSRHVWIAWRGLRHNRSVNRLEAQMQQLESKLQDVAGVEADAILATLSSDSEDSDEDESSLDSEDSDEDEGGSSSHRSSRRSTEVRSRYDSRDDTLRSWSAQNAASHAIAAAAVAAAARSGAASNGLREVLSQSASTIFIDEDLTPEFPADAAAGTPGRQQYVSYRHDGAQAGTSTGQAENSSASFWGDFLNDASSARASRIESEVSRLGTSAAPRTYAALPSPTVALPSPAAARGQARKSSSESEVWDTWASRATSETASTGAMSPTVVPRDVGNAPSPIDPASFAAQLSRFSFGFGQAT